MKEVLIVIYVISLIICLIQFIIEATTIRKPTLIEFLASIGVFISLFIPILNTIYCYKIYKEYK